MGAGDGAAAARCVLRFSDSQACTAREEFEADMSDLFRRTCRGYGTGIQHGDPRCHTRAPTGATTFYNTLCCRTLRRRLLCRSTLRRLHRRHLRHRTSRRPPTRHQPAGAPSGAGLHPHRRGDSRVVGGIAAASHEIAFPTPRLRRTPRFGEVLRGVLALVRDRGVAIDANYMTLVTNVLCLEGMAGTLVPEYNVLDAARPLLDAHRALPRPLFRLAMPLVASLKRVKDRVCR